MSVAGQSPPTLKSGLHKNTSCFSCLGYDKSSGNRSWKLKHYNIPDFVRLLDSTSSNRTSENEASEGTFFCSSFKLCAICYIEKSEGTLKSSFQLFGNMNMFFL